MQWGFFGVLFFMCHDFLLGERLEKSIKPSKKNYVLVGMEDDCGR